MPRTPKIVEDRQEQIIDAAMRVFARKGFTGATNRDVAREAGITTGLIYYYFKNKEDLLRAVLEAHSPTQIMAQIPPEMLEQPPDVFLPIVIMRVLSIVEDEQFLGVMRVLLPEVQMNPHIASIALNFLQRVIGFLGEYIQTQIGKGTIRADINQGLIPQLLVSTLMGFVLRRKIMLDAGVLHYTHEELAQTITDTILAGLLLR